MQIIDSPSFAWRGVLLDVGRHYFSVAFHKKFLDAMALHKMNKFHWHLTEDQVSNTADAQPLLHPSDSAELVCFWHMQDIWTSYRKSCSK